MSMLLRKGLEYTADYSSINYPTLDANWTGSISLFTEYPGTATTTKALVRVGNVMKLVFTVADILALELGVYTVESTMANTVLGVTLVSVEYATVTAALSVGGDMTVLTMTVNKIDGTPAGSATKTIQNTVDGAVVVNGWKGVQVTARQADAYNIGTDIIGVETVTTETNAAGYAQIAVVKGSTVNVACPSFGKSVTVDTTGLDEIDLSSYF